MQMPYLSALEYCCKINKNIKIFSFVICQNIHTDFMMIDGREEEAIFEARYIDICTNVTFF